MAKSARQNSAALAKIKAEQRAAERRRSLLIGGVATVVVLVIIGAVIFFALFAPKPAQTAAATSGAISDTLQKELTSVPASAFDTVGVGTSQASVLKPTSGGTLEKKDGKPRVVYVGADYCPFCASERWSLVTALARFGTWSGLEYMASSATDTPASVPTLSLKNAKFTSDYLSFEAYEIQDRDGKAQQTAPADVTAMMKTLDPSGGIPFVSFAGLASQSGTLVDNTIFGDQPQDTIGADIKNPSSDISKAVLGGANITSAQICKLTDNQPAAVCSSSGVSAGAAALPKS